MSTTHVTAQVWLNDRLSKVIFYEGLRSLIGRSFFDVTTFRKERNSPPRDSSLTIRLYDVEGVERNLRSFFRARNGIRVRYRDSPNSPQIISPEEHSEDLALRVGHYVRRAPCHHFCDFVESKDTQGIYVIDGYAFLL